MIGNPLAATAFHVSTRGDFLDIHGILPARAGKIVIHCGPRSVGGVDFVGA